MKQKAPGKTLLQVVGIILVVFGILGFLVNLVNFAMLGTIGEGEMGELLEQTILASGITVQAYRISVYLTAAGSLLYAVMGIIGIVNCNKIQKAGVCFICGIILIVWRLGNDAYSAAVSGITVLGLVSIVIGLILPLLYFWGALKNRQAMLDGKAQ